MTTVAANAAVVPMDVAMASVAAPEPSLGVVQGEDGWCFDRQAVSLLTGQAREPARALAVVDAWRDRLTNDHELLAARGIRYFHICVPDKLRLQGEFLGTAAEGTGSLVADGLAHSPMHQLSARYRKVLPCLLDPSNYLARQKDNFQLYWKRDTRWSPWASFMTYQLLCGQLEATINGQLLGYPHDECARLMNLDDGTRPADSQQIRTYRLQNRSRRRYADPLATQREQRLDAGDPRLSVDRYGQGAHVVFENRHAQAENLSVMIFGDANSADNRSLFTGMLAETFSEVHFIWAPALDHDYIKEVKPDVVISQATELQMSEPPVSTCCYRTLARQSLQNLDSEVQAVLPAAPTARHRTRLLLPAEEYDLEPAIVLQPEARFDKPETRMLSNEVSLTEVDEATVYFKGGSWLVHDGENTEVLRHGVPDSQKRAGRWSRPGILPGVTLMFASSAGAHCYYHWMLEILPKLGMLEREGISLDSIDHFLVRNISGNWQLQTLKRFGIDESRIVETVQQPHLRCERLLHIDLNCGINLKMHRFIPLWMKHLYPADNAGKPRIRLYITRPEGVRRGIRNEHEFLPLLEEAGFVTKAMEGLSVAEQAALLARTDVLMSPHGGALTNMVFCRPGSTIIELYSRHVFPYYYGLAASCGHRYHAILENPAEDYPRLVSGRIAQRFADNQHETAELSFDAPVDAIRRVLDSLPGI